MSSGSETAEESKAISMKAGNAMEAEKRQQYQSAWSDAGNLDEAVSRWLTTS